VTATSGVLMHTTTTHTRVYDTCGAALQQFFRERLRSYVACWVEAVREALCAAQGIAAGLIGAALQLATRACATASDAQVRCFRTTLALLIVVFSLPSCRGNQPVGFRVTSG
jgi:hypothetical protein